MKLLLTSAGITNDKIAKALFELTGKKPEEITVAFIPTASNAEIGDKDWLISDLINLKKQHFGSIEITDISAIDEQIWKPSLERADVLYFEGGNTYHLMRWLERSGLSGSLVDLLQNKVYVGVSAGSMVTSPDLALKLSQVIYEEDMIETEVLEGLGLVDFYFLPHLNSEWFKNVRKENIEKVGKEMNQRIYALDDQSALKIDGDVLEVVGEGEWFMVNDQ